MPKKREFEHESLQDAVSLVEYLRAITEGFENGTLSLNGSQGDMLLRPTGMIRFDVHAKQAPDRSKLTLRFTWKPTSTIDGDDDGPLTITGQES